MIVAGVVLLAAALVAFVVGLLTDASGWLVASLVATLAAAVLLVLQLRSARTTTATEPSPETDDAADADEPADAEDVDEPADAKDAEDAEDAEDADHVPTGTDALPVWVVDGEPDFHRPHCARLSGEDAESVPRAQAVEDGFNACPDCTPDNALVP